MKDNDNADRTPRVVLGRAVPAGATVAYRVGDDGWDGWEIDVLEDPAAVLASDELVAVLDEPEPRPWPSAPLIRVWEGSDDGVVVDLAPPQPTLPDLAEPSDAEVRAAAVEFEQHEQFWYDDDDQPRCECGFRLEESPNGDPIPSLQIHQARAGLLAARKVARHE